MLMGVGGWGSSQERFQQGSVGAGWWAEGKKLVRKAFLPSEFQVRVRVIIISRDIAEGMQARGGRALNARWRQTGAWGALEPGGEGLSVVSSAVCHGVMGLDVMILVFGMLNFKAGFLLSCFTFIKRLFSSSSLSAIRLVSSAYLRLLIFLPAILILACASSSLAFHKFP